MFPYGSYLVEVLILWYFTARGLFSSFLLPSVCHQYTHITLPVVNMAGNKILNVFLSITFKGKQNWQKQVHNLIILCQVIFSSALQNWPLQLKAEEAPTCCTVIFSWRRRRGAVIFIRQLHCLGCCRPHSTSASADRIQVEKTSCPW